MSATILDRIPLAGGDGDDLLYGSQEDEFIHGGRGVDTLVLKGNSRADYTIRVEAGHIVLAHRDGVTDGVDAVVQVEKLQFAGGVVDMSPLGTIARMYEALFDRAPDPAGLDFWAGAYGAGVSLPEIAAGLVASDEAHVELTNNDFVTSLYVNGVGRPADLKELSQYTWRFDGLGQSRADVLLYFADSAPMLVRDKATQGTVDFAATDVGSLVRMYETLFDRAPDAAGLNHWIGVSESGVGLAQIADAFVLGAELQTGGMSNAQFVAHLYEAGLERTGDQAETAWWAEQIDSGTLTRGEVLLGIADSAEMVELVGMLSTSLPLSA